MFTNIVHFGLWHSILIVEMENQNPKPDYESSSGTVYGPAKITKVQTVLVSNFESADGTSSIPFRPS